MLNVTVKTHCTNKMRSIGSANAANSHKANDMEAIDRKMANEAF
ncbi:hypothetical protein SDC9_188746 [bioreactor metagenome]|uniref:Uncharacterized protein n=1 Tax=bioreactor metagenome TaxID=1076179 RepID=A0A645HYF4_9ZZZZ